MTHTIRLTCFAAIVLIMGTGCATTTIVQYDFENLSTVRADSTRQAMRVAVAPLQDLRTAEERNPGTTLAKLQTRDSMFKDGDVARGISEALITHFNHVQLFKIAEMADQTAMLPTSAVLESVKGQGFDALFTGTLKHFYGAGYPTVFDGVAIVLSLVPVTVLVTLPIMYMQENQNEGFVEILDAQLTDTKTGAVLWSGTFSKKREMKYPDAYPARAASETLKDIADEIVKQIVDSNIQ
jgi:TolB-like protein